MSERFYVSSPLRPGPLVLQGAEAAHLYTVCRLRPGQWVRLFNGDGCEYAAEITQAERKAVAVQVHAGERVSRELARRLTVACPLPRGDRGQFLVEKLTELGVSRYVPLLTERTVFEPSAARRQKLLRWVIEASKQCGRNVLMEAAEPLPWVRLQQQADLPPHKYFASPGGELLPRQLPAVDAIVVVGPEGGFTLEEEGQARAGGWQLVSLGKRTLRVETAALVLAAALGERVERGEPAT
jgi:16S rRNA (uracil1498-N3)-methyltransferase